MAIFSKRNLRFIKIWILSPLVEKLLIIFYICLIFTFISYYNIYKNDAKPNDIRREFIEYFKYDKFLNITTIDKDQDTISAVNNIEYDFYDYLNFLVKDRLFVAKRSPYRVMGVFRIMQERITLSQCDDMFNGTCDFACYQRLHSSQCSKLYKSDIIATSYTRTEPCAMEMCQEYDYIHHDSVSGYDGVFGEYGGK